MNQFTKILCLTCGIAAVSFAYGAHEAVFADGSNIGVYIDGTEVDFPDVKPYISEDRTFVPVRFVSEQLGASVEWNDENGTGPGKVSISKDNDNIKLSIGSTKLVKNGVASSMDVAPVITGSRTMVPLRFVSEQLGAVVKWDAAKNSVLITTGKASSAYTVKQGDTLWGIASVYGTSIGEILNMNPGLDPNKLMVGQEINLTSVSGGKEKPNPSDTAAQSDGVAVKTENIAFNTTYERTDSLYRGEEQVKKAGVPGIREVTVKTTTAENGSKKTEIVKTTVIQEPVNQITLIGTRSPEVSRGERKTVSLNGSGDEIVAYAKEFLGAPYAYGGATPGGFDCSGFTQFVAAHFGGILPHSSSGQYYYGINVEREDLQPGDLVFFESPDDPMTIGHVGIYVGGGQFIHAPQANDPVKITNLSNVYFDPRFYGAVRLNTRDSE